MALPPAALAPYVRYHPRAVTPAALRALAEAAADRFPAERSQCVVYGKTYPVPRDQFVVLLLDEGKGGAGAGAGASGHAASEQGAYCEPAASFDYSYSHQRVPVRPTFPALERVRAETEALTGVRYNFVLVNRYRDGRDGVGWHADDEATVDATQPIASVSVGGSRDFDVRLTRQPGTKHRWRLSDGDLLVMLPGCQAHCQHQVPKRAHAAPRINLTFRVLKP